MSYWTICGSSFEPPGREFEPPWERVCINLTCNEPCYRPSILLSICPLIYPFMCLFLGLSTCVRLFVHLSIHPINPPCIYLFGHPSIYLFISPWSAHRSTHTITPSSRKTSNQGVPSTTARDARQVLDRDPRRQRERTWMTVIRKEAMPSRRPLQDYAVARPT
jgi:hypothetical protein